MQLQPIGHKKIRAINQNMLLNLIRMHAPISRTQLQKISGLSQGTVVNLITQLIERDLVTETGMAASTGGRKAGLLELFPQGAYAIGIHLMEHLAIVALLDLQGEIHTIEIIPLHLRDHGDEAVVLIASCIEQFIAKSGVPRQKIIGLGCGISGPVNRLTGVSVDSWILNWHQISIRQPLSERLGMPVFVENAVNCLASYEKLYGRGETCSDFLVISLGRGLGLATVLNHGVYRGAKGIGAEFGHIPLANNGRLCECGNPGCLEAYVADYGIVETYRELGGSLEPLQREQVDERIIDILYERAQNGDAAAILTFHRTGKFLGLGIASLVNLYNPACIMIYGGAGHRIELMRDTIHSTLEKHIFSRLGQGLTILVDTDTNMDNWARGAGCLVLQDFFAPTLFNKQAL